MSDVSAQIRKRLQPLYWAAFFNGLVFWYVVDKLLTTQIGVSTAHLGIILAFMSLVTVIGEVPSGILADRWSRKGVLLIAVLFLLASSFFGLIATGPVHYWALSICWGVYAAMYSGTYEAIVYDVILEESGEPKKYEQLFGRVGRYESIGLVIGSILGGFFTAQAYIKIPFALSLLSCLVACFFVVKFKEPLVHKSHEATKFVRHIKDTMRSVVASKLLVHYFLISLFLGVTFRIYWEYTQFWYIQLGLPKELFGIVWSAMLLTIWVRSFLADRIKTKREMLLFITLLMAFFGGLALTVHNPWVAVVAALFVMICNQLSYLILSGLQQALLPSRLRAGATSLFNSTGNIMFIPMGMAFGFLALDGNITRAAWLPVGIMLCSVLIAASAMRMAHDTVK